ncbi:MAG: Rne/Rng family ribonuclease [Acidobacteriota bacterium]
MSKKMLVESDPHETRIAVMEQDRLTELFIERHQQLGVVGNIYKGRVNRVLPGMQAAFVDIGLDRDAFLYVSEVTDPHLSPFDDHDGGDGGEGDGEALDPAEVERPSIDQLLRPGQQVMVQVLKDAMPNKGARVSTQITLPGRSLVLLPNVPHLGISRRIEDEDTRARLRELLEELQPPGMGLIVRTAGLAGDRDEFEADLEYLTKLWARISDRGERVSAPTLIHRDLDLALRVVRDFLSEDFRVIWVDGEETYERLVDFIDQVQPSMLGRIKLSRHDDGLFERFDIDDEIEAALKTKVWLKSGGHIVIHPTEALVAIDVNTGRYVGRHNLEDTVLTTNLEAVREIVRQVRLRNLGGIIVIDLIDMEEESHRQEVFAALEEELAKDRAKNKVLNISEFGLVELTRKRSRPSLERLLTQPCPYCRGTGRIKALSSIALGLRRQILRQRARYLEGELLLRVHPDVATALQRQEQSILRELEETLGSQILIQSDPSLHHERFDILDV